VASAVAASDEQAVEAVDHPPRRAGALEAGLVGGQAVGRKTVGVLGAADVARQQVGLLIRAGVVEGHRLPRRETEAQWAHRVCP
jgi:hypothetical protein